MRDDGLVGTYAREMSEPRNVHGTRGAARLSARIWIGIGALFGVLALAIALSVAALLVSYGALRRIAELSAAERHAAAIGVASREQYMHQLHGVLLRDAKHVGHDQHWASMLAKHVEHLRPRVGDQQRKQLDVIESESRALSRIFADRIFPAAVAGGGEDVRSAHDEAERRLAALIGASDASVAHLSTRTRDASAFAITTARTASVAAVAATVLAAILAIALALGFARRIVRPVAALNAAAARIGQGDFEADAGPTGTLELDELRAGLRQMAERLREREARLLRAERLATIGSFAAGVAHELNNPLGVILGYLKGLRRSPATSLIRDELRILDDEAHQCRRIVEDLVIFAHEPRLERSVVELGAYVREVCARLESSGEIAGLRVVVDAKGPIEACVDAQRIGQVVRNLVLNAAAASAAGEPVEVSMAGGEGEACIVVRDHGAGIDPQDLDRVFEPFFSRRPGGTGLGLAVCHGIVRGHGGSIAIESARGAGTAVTVRLPSGLSSEG